MNEDILIEMKNKASNIRNLIDECNELMNYLENITNKIKSKKEQMKKENLEENPKNIDK
jgi:predicted  nucleic acid-binding Zn-ribbon protein